VTEARQQEIFYLRRELAVWASTLFIMVMSPVVATAATFSVYVLVSEDNILTAAMSFSVLLLFAALRFPINYAGRFAGSKFDFLWMNLGTRCEVRLLTDAYLTRLLHRSLRTGSGTVCRSTNHSLLTSRNSNGY
jgi:hypothetical protein